MKERSEKLYQRVANAITTAIEEGQYTPGSRLPGERELAEDFSVSRPTVREAMIALEIRGLVEARHGSGVYVIAPPAETAFVLAVTSVSSVCLIPTPPVPLVASIP